MIWFRRLWEYRRLVFSFVWMVVKGGFLDEVLYNDYFNLCIGMWIMVGWGLGKRERRDIKNIRSNSYVKDWVI